MQGRGLITVVLVLAVIVSTTLLAGCAQEKEQNQQVPTPKTEQGAKQQQQTIDLSKYRTIADLMGLNIGVYCEGTQSVNGKTFHYKYWTKSGKMRAEVEQNGKLTIMVAKEDGSYISMQEIKQETGCDWLKVPKGEEGKEAKVTGGTYQKPEEVDITKFNCRPETFTEDKFQTPGKVCTLEDLMKAYMQKYTQKS